MNSHSTDGTERQKNESAKPGATMKHYSEAELYAYVRGRAGQSSHGIEGHLETCSECKEWMNDFRDAADVNYVENVWKNIRDEVVLAPAREARDAVARKPKEVTSVQTTSAVKHSPEISPQLMSDSKSVFRQDTTEGKSQMHATEAKQHDDVETTMISSNEVLRKIRKKRSLSKALDLLLFYGKQLGIHTLRFHHIDRRGSILTLVDSAGLASEITRQIRLKGMVRHWESLPLDTADALWSFELGRPVLLCVNQEAKPPLAVSSQLGDIDVIQVPKNQCPMLDGFKGSQWVDFPMEVCVCWTGKLSCDVDLADTKRPDFGRRMMQFWKLAKIAAPYLEYLHSQNNVSPPKTKLVVPKTIVKPCSATQQNRNAMKQYERKHGCLDNKAIAAYVASMLRHYERNAMALDGGSTNLAIAEAIAHHADQGLTTVDAIVTNNLDVPKRIPCGENFPSVDVIGGRVRENRRTTLGYERIKRIEEDYTFAVSVLGATGLKPPWLFNGTGEDNRIKRALINASADIIFPLPSFKWGSTGRKFLDLRDLLARDRSVFLVTVFPHEDFTDGPSIRAQSVRFQQAFLEGAQQIIRSADYCANVGFAKAEFAEGLFPQITPINFDGDDLMTLYHELKPDRRIDFRLVICIDLQPALRPAPDLIDAKDNQQRQQMAAN